MSKSYNQLVWILGFSLIMHQLAVTTAHGTGCPPDQNFSFTLDPDETTLIWVTDIGPVNDGFTVSGAGSQIGSSGRAQFYGLSPGSGSATITVHSTCDPLTTNYPGAEVHVGSGVLDLKFDGVANSDDTSVGGGMCVGQHLLKLNFLPGFTNSYQSVSVSWTPAGKINLYNCSNKCFGSIDNGHTFTSKSAGAGLWIEALDTGTCTISATSFGVTESVLVTIGKVDLDIDGVADADEESVGATIVRNFNSNGAPRKKITLQHVDTTSGWTNNLILTKQNSKIKVFNAITNGTEITFNGTDNKFANSALPTDLWVEGTTASTSMRDTSLTLMAENEPGCTNKVKFSVLWVTITGRFSGSITNDNSAIGNYLNQTAPSRTTLGSGQFWDRMGWGVEFVGSVSPTNFNQDVLMERDGDGKGYKGLTGQGADWTLSPNYPNVPPGSDTSLANWRDDDPQSGGSGGKVYDSDDPGVFTKYDDVANFIRRSRFNFKAFATFDSTRCSPFFNWYCKASYKKTGTSATGTATATSASSLTDTNQSWTTDQWKDGTVAITAGTGAGQYRYVTGNTVDTVSVGPNWVPALDSTSVYLINGSNTWTQINDVTGDNVTGSGGPIPLTWDLH